MMCQATIPLFILFLLANYSIWIGLVSALSNGSWIRQTEKSAAIHVPSSNVVQLCDGPTSRRAQIQAIAALSLGSLILEQPSYASDLFIRDTDQLHYTFRPPSGFEDPTQKPLKTHLDEVTFKRGDVQFGITVDPLRISKLSDFGTPEEVAAKVVTAEVNRDGVFDVQLMEDPIAGGVDGSSSYYQLNYRSNGKRGVKRYVAKFYIEKQKLYALTAQCKEENFASFRDDILEAVKSFQVK